MVAGVLMKTLKTMLTLFVFYFGMAHCCASHADDMPAPARQAYIAFQADADIVRLNHLRYWVGEIEAYHKKTGKYPLQGVTDNPVYVFVASPMQEQSITQAPPSPAIVKPMKDFVDALETGLEKSIDEFYDPQYAPDAKPNFYIYLINGADYYFAVHTHQNFAFSKIIGPDYNKIEVSNTYNPSANLILTSSILFNSQAFKDAVDAPPQKKEFFQQREELTRHATKALQAIK